jgi:excisionase family DNA binding protein
MKSRDWMSVTEAAQALRVSTRTVRRWLKAGTLQAELRPGPRGRQYAIPAAQVRTLNEERQQPALQPDVPTGFSRELDLRLAEIWRELVWIRHEIREMRPTSQVSRVEAQDILSDPDGHIGRQVRIVGRLTSVVTDLVVVIESQLLVLDGTGTLTREVLAQTPVIDVTGVVRALDIRVAKLELNVDLADQILVPYIGHPVLFARSVQSGPEDGFYAGKGSH